MECKGFVLKGTSQSVEMVVGQVTPDVTSVRDADRVIGRYFDIDKAQIQLNVERQEGRQVVETSTPSTASATFNIGGRPGCCRNGGFPLVGRYGCRVVTGSELHKMESRFCALDVGRRSLRYERTNMISTASVQAQGTLRLSPEQVRELLPQRGLFLFVNGPADVVPGVRVAAQATYPEDSSFYTGHFPGFPLTPGVIIIETMVQAASLMMLTTPRCSGQIVYFVGIREARFFKAVLPGAVVELTGSVVSIRHGSSRAAWRHGRVTSAQPLRL